MRTFTKQEDARDRARVAALVDRQGLANHAAKRPGKGVILSSPEWDDALDDISAQQGYGTAYAGAYNPSGRIVLHTSVRALLAEAVTAIDEGRSLDSAQTWAVKVATHEDLHGRSPLHFPTTYAGQAQVIEEVTTEVLARDLVCAVTGSHRATVAIMGNPKGIYQDFIERQVQVIADMGATGPVATLQAAALRFKRRAMDSLRTEAAVVAAWDDDVRASITL